MGQHCFVLHTPNLTTGFWKRGYEIPIMELLSQVANNLGEIAFTGAFHNSGCPENVLRLFKQNDCTLISCVSQKRNSDTSGGSDAVDEEIQSTVRKLLPIADVHVLVSGDQDFASLLSSIRQKPGKTAYRVYVKQNSVAPFLYLDLEDNKIEIASKAQQVARW
jgi:hypothetical protein